MSSTKTNTTKTQATPHKSKNKLNMSRPQAVYDDEYDFSVQHSKCNHRNGEYKSLMVGAKKSVTLTKTAGVSNVEDDEYYDNEEYYDDEEYYEEEVPVQPNKNSESDKTSETNKESESSTK